MQQSAGIGISGTGSYLPSTTVSNEQLAAVLGTTADAIWRVTGIRARRVRDRTENIYVMGAAAGLRALEDAGLTLADVDALYCAIDATGELTVPAAANIIQYLMGLPTLCDADGQAVPNYCPAGDIVAGCCGPLFALDVAVRRVFSDRYLYDRGSTRVLVVAGDAMSTIVNWRDRETAMVFADGIGAVVVEDLRSAAERGAVQLDAQRPAGVLSVHLASDGAKADTICLFSPNRASSPSDEPAESPVPREYVRMKGAEVYRHAVRRLKSSLRTALDQAGLTDADVDLFVPHQANLQILRKVFPGMIPDDAAADDGDGRVYVRGVVREGNCSAGTLFVALDKLSRAGRLRPGMTLALPSFGAGMTWGTAVLRWHKPRRPRLEWDAYEARQRAADQPLAHDLHERYVALEEKMRTSLSLV